MTNGIIWYVEQEVTILNIWGVRTSDRFALVGFSFRIGSVAWLGGCIDLTGPKKGGTSRMQDESSSEGAAIHQQQQKMAAGEMKRSLQWTFWTSWFAHGLLRDPVACQLVEHGGSCLLFYVINQPGSSRSNSDNCHYIGAMSGCHDIEALIR